MKSSLILKQMQMAYLELILRQEGEGKRCPICWHNHCNHHIDIKQDPFINLTENLKYV